MTPTTNSARKRGADPHSTNKRTNEKKGRLKDPPPNTLEKHDDDQNKHPFAVLRNLKAALKNESYGTDEFVRNLSVEITTCFTALTTKVYLVSKIIESKPRPDFRKSTSTTSPAKKKGRATKKKSDTTFSDLGPIPHQIDVMVDFLLYKLDNRVTGVMGLLSRKQISERFKDYNMRNKWYNFDTIKKYMIMYREILVWYMKNVQYPPGADYTPEALCFHTKGQNCSPRASKQYVKSMKNFLDCLMAKSSLRVSTSHSYNQVDLDKHFKKQNFYQYFLPELIQNSFVLGTTVLSGEKWVPVGFHQQGDTNIRETGKVLLPPHSPLVFHYVIHYKDTVSNYYNIHFDIDDDRVTLSPCKLGTGKTDLAHFTITKGILYLVKQWLITKFANHGTNLGVNVVLSFETKCNLFICQVLCASMIRVDGIESSFDCSIDNVCKKIIHKVFKSPHKCCFGYDHVMETIEGLVLTERSFLKGAMVPELREENVAYFQRNDRLYIFHNFASRNFLSTQNSSLPSPHFLSVNTDTRPYLHLLQLALSAFVIRLGVHCFLWLLWLLLTIAADTFAALHPSSSGHSTYQRLRLLTIKPHAGSPTTFLLVVPCGAILASFASLLPVLHLLSLGLFNSYVVAAPHSLAGKRPQQRSHHPPVPHRRCSDSPLPHCLNTCISSALPPIAALSTCTAHRLAPASRTYSSLSNLPTAPPHAHTPFAFRLPTRRHSSLHVLPLACFLLCSVYESHTPLGPASVTSSTNHTIQPWPPRLSLCSNPPAAPSTANPQRTLLGSVSLLCLPSPHHGPPAGLSSASSPKKRLQANPSLSSLSARSSGSRYPKCAQLKKSSPPPTTTRATPSPSSLRPWKDASLSASSSLASHSSVTSMSVSSSDSSPPALKQLVLTPSALPQPLLTPALKQSLLQPSPSPTPSPGLDHQALHKQALAAANQAHSASFIWRFYGDGCCPIPTSIQHLRKLPAQTRVLNASPSPTHFFSKKDGRDKKSIHDVCRLLVAPVYASVNPDAPDWRSAPLESLFPLRWPASKALQIGPNPLLAKPSGNASLVLPRCLLNALMTCTVNCEGNLMPSTEGQVWLSANRVLGSHWFFKTKPPAPAPAPTAASKSSTQVSGSWSVSFFPSVGAALVISSSVGHFLQRRGVCSSDSRTPVDVTEGTKCSYSSYFTLSLPRLMSPPPSDLYNEMLESLTDALSLLWSVDRKLVLYVFPSRASINPKAKPVPKLWSTLPDRRTLELYVASLWLRVRAAPHLRFYMGHSVPVDTLLSDTLLQRLQDREMDFKYDHIQASTTVTCGFLLGSYMQSFDLDHYNALLQTHPWFQAFPIAFIWKNIWLDNSQTSDPSPVPAAHILCDSTKHSMTVKLLKAQFNHCSASDIVSLPDGKFYKFIETATNPSDPCLPLPSKLKTLRQAKFIKTRESASVLGVADLDLPVDLGHSLGATTLRRVLLGIRTRDNWLWPLFLSVDTSSYRGEILALYNTTTSAEAQTM
eukprot:jgi/Psemu1/36454/gm1.36454_g